MKTRGSFWAMPLLFVFLLMVSACGSSSGGSGGSSGTPAGGISDQNGTSVSTVGDPDPVYLSLSGLTANTQYNITVTDPNGDALSPDGGFVATTDEDGEVPTSTLLQDLSQTGAVNSLVMRGTHPWPRLQATTGQYTVVVTDENGEEIITDTFDVIDSDKVFCANSGGVGGASFTPSESVYARIEKGADGDLADGTYTCYVFSDLNVDIEDDEVLSGNTVSITVASGVGQATMGTFGSGQYDVACDINANGTFDAGTDLLARPGRFRPCFTVQTANSGNDIIGQVCSDRNGNYRDIFDPNATDTDIRDVWAWISPAEQSLVQHTIGVRKYVVNHSDSWTDGDTLTDVTGPSSASAFEVDSVQGFCTNEAPWLIWPRERLTAGCYDCIIDVNYNGTYDKGTDFIDNIDNNGDNTTCGMRVADTSCASDAVAISSHSDGTTVTSTAITLTGIFAETPDSASVTVTAGEQSNTINMSVSDTTFSAAIPLFSGENIITVTAIRSNETACSKTIKVTSNSSSSANELFRAQMTWDGDTDMDLHLVKPSGSYSNGGGGTDDCNYGNCKVGLDGSGTNSIDWGDAGEDDDPKLDVDCIGCGNGIENIWLNEIPEDGDYAVYVDAFSGTETAVNVSISIRGATVGTVSCGAMASNTATDSCYVGYIRWSGGSSGSGTFYSVGTKATDF